MASAFNKARALGPSRDGTGPECEEYEAACALQQGPGRGARNDAAADAPTSGMLVLQ